jgi:hypothetical protein
MKNTVRVFAIFVLLTLWAPLGYCGNQERPICDLIDDMIRSGLEFFVNARGNPTGKNQWESKYGPFSSGQCAVFRDLQKDALACWYVDPSVSGEKAFDLYAQTVAAADLCLKTLSAAWKRTEVGGRSTRYSLRTRDGQYSVVAELMQNEAFFSVNVSFSFESMPQ